MTHLTGAHPLSLQPPVLTNVAVNIIIRAWLLTGAGARTDNELSRKYSQYSEKAPNSESFLVESAFTHENL